MVRRAGKDEKFVTLDGQERQMDENVLMICDAEKAVGIAGIMGGENSMITDNVKRFCLKQPALTEPTSVFPVKEWDSVPMHPVNLRKVWIRIMRKQRSTVPAS